MDGKMTCESKLEIQAREFQEAILRSVEQHTAPYQVKLKGRDFVMFPDTFNPNYAKASLLLLDNLGVHKMEVVLDPFTGCGADAIFAVLGGAYKTVAIDKYTMPYLCARYNVHKFELESMIDVRQGDLFDVLKPDERFDLVVANPPWKCMKPKSDIEAAVRDNEYATIKRFWKEVGNYMKPEGRIRVVFSDVGDMDYFHYLANKNGFNCRTVAEERFASDVKIEVYEFRKS